MFIPRLQMSFLRNKKDSNLDSKLQQFESDIKKNYHVSCRDNLNEYLNESTLHGLRYVGDRRISHFERAFFALMFLVVLLLSAYFISNVWLKYQSTPIIISLSSESTSIKDLPFPAVTVCNMNQVRKSAIQNISKDSREYAVVKGLCRQDFYLENETLTKAATWDMYRKMLLKVAPPCEEMLIWCFYGGVEFNCTSRMRTILTDDGLCCNFNGVPKRYLMKTSFKNFEEFDEPHTLKVNMSGTMWTPENGYDKSKPTTNPEDIYPIPGIGSGNEMGLAFILKADIDDYFCSSTRSYGFKVLLHSPNELPKVAHFGIAIPTNYESRIAVTPMRSIATPSIRSISRSVRQCIFEKENFLSFYSTYSEMNCQSECETKLLYKQCGCILYYQPREHSNISICGTADWNCVRKVDQEIQLKQNTSYKCNDCLNGCFNINYEPTFSTAKIFPQIPILRQRGLDPNNVGIVQVYYSRSTFRSRVYEPLFGFTEFLSNMGGLLGLFMGFSVISAIEMFYFISIRPYCNYLRFSNKRHELLSKLYRKMDKLRQRKHSQFMISTVQPNLNFGHDYHHRRYADL